MRLKLIGFRSHGARTQDPPLVEPTPEQLHIAAETLRSEGAFDLLVI